MKEVCRLCPSHSEGGVAYVPVSHSEGGVDSPPSQTRFFCFFFYISDTNAFKEQIYFISVLGHFSVNTC